MLSRNSSMSSSLKKQNASMILMGIRRPVVLRGGELQKPVARLVEGTCSRAQFFEVVNHFSTVLRSSVRVLAPRESEFMEFDLQCERHSAGKTAPALAMSLDLVREILLSEVQRLEVGRFHIKGVRGAADQDILTDVGMDVSEDRSPHGRRQEEKWVEAQQKINREEGRTDPLDGQGCIG